MKGKRTKNGKKLGASTLLFIQNVFVLTIGFILFKLSSKDGEKLDLGNKDRV